MRGFTLSRRFLVLAIPLFLFAASMSAPAWALFTEQGATVLGAVNYEARSASLADIDNDGDLDLFFQGTTAPGLPVARQMFRNNVIGTGSLTFTNITASMNLTGLGASWSAAWGDYDSDGMIDVFVGQSNTESAAAAGDVLRNTGSGFPTLARRSG